jgi:PQQ-dependent catabolism-associated CXXCW motif protein
MRMRNNFTATVGVLLLSTHASLIGQNSFSDDIHAMKPRPAIQTPVASETAVQTPSKPQDSPASADPRFAKVAAIESQDFGVKPTDRLHGDPMHAPTPTTIPGGLVISTEALNGLYENSRGRFMVFDVLGGRTGLPDAQNALPASNAGSFDDQTQREFGNYLQQVTAGDKKVPLVFYCQSVECWMSYNAALRAIRLGYTQVLWYRGGIEAWEQAKLPTQPR